MSKTVKPGSILHLYGEWIDVNIDIEEFGINGTDENDDTESFQRILNLAKYSDEIISITVPAGKYYISNTLVVYSNTYLKLDSNANIIRTNDKYGMVSCDSTKENAIGGYSYLKNVTIDGGIWDGNVTSVNEKGQGYYANTLFYFWHGDNIQLKNMLISGCCGNHFIELAGIRNSCIENVKLSDFVEYMYDDTEIASKVSEAIQLDYTGEENSAGAYPYDGTPCENITINGCEFDNCLSGIGNHHEKSRAEGIIIENNSFSRMKASCLNVFYMDNVYIAGNTAQDISNFISSIDSTKITLKNNIIKNTKENVQDSCIIVKNSDIKILNNNFDEIHNNVIYMEACNEVSVLENVIANVSKNGIIIEECSDAQKIEIKGNDLYNIGSTGVFLKKNASVILIEANKIKQISGYGIQIDEYSNGNIINNIIQNTEKSALQIKEGDYCIQKNIIKDSAKNGIDIVAGNDEKTEIKDNSISQCKMNGISVYNGVKCELLNNCIFDNDNHGVLVNHLCSVLIKDNDIYNNGYSYHDIMYYDGCKGKVEFNRVGKGGISISKKDIGNRECIVEVNNNSLYEKFFTIIYKGNGGSGSMAEQEVTYGVTTVLNGNAFVRNGYHFTGWTVYRESDKKWYTTAGWKTEAEISSNKYKKQIYTDKTTVARTSAVNGDRVILTAEWKANVFTVVYKGNGGSGSMADQEVTYGVTTVLNGNAFVRNGYHFTGWTVYRESDKKWYTTAGWKTEAEISSNKYKKQIYTDKTTVARTSAVNGDRVILTANWQ